MTVRGIKGPRSGLAIGSLFNCSNDGSGRWRISPQVSVDFQKAKTLWLQGGSPAVDLHRNIEEDAHDRHLSLRR